MLAPRSRWFLHRLISGRPSGAIERIFQYHLCVPGDRGHRLWRCSESCDLYGLGFEAFRLLGQPTIQLSLIFIGFSAPRKRHESPLTESIPKKRRARRLVYVLPSFLRFFVVG